MINIRSVGTELRGIEDNIIDVTGVIRPTNHLTSDEIRKYTSTLKDCLLEISRELGYHGLLFYSPVRN